MLPLPPKLESRRAGETVYAGLGTSTILPDFDFETYSSAGFIWNGSSWGCPRGANKKGLPVTGVAYYAEYPDTEVLSLAYDLKDGKGKQLWRRGDPREILEPLFRHVRQGGLLEAWNVAFEYWIWKNVCEPKMGWPYLPRSQLRCAMAKARAFGLPGHLEEAGNVLNIENKKLTDGKRLIQKFSVPRNPTKTDPNLRIIPTYESDPDTKLFWEYNLRDIAAEAEISSRVPDLSADELKFWQCDRDINFRGVQVDVESIHACIAIIEQAAEKYNQELRNLTGIPTLKASEVQQLVKWLNLHSNLTFTNLDEETLENALKNERLLPQACRVLEIRQILGSASVKKIYAMANQVTKAGRLHELFIYHSARTGRAAGAGPQPQNLPNGGPNVQQCDNTGCNRFFIVTGLYCPWCGKGSLTPKIHEWGIGAVENALEVIKTGSLECVELYFKNAVAVVSGCLRGLFIAATGKVLTCSDYTAIEAVVLAALAGEEWRLEVFRTHGKIYEMSASKITGVPFEEYEKHQLTTGGVRQPDGSVKGGQHHPTRKTVGKVAELASGYQGWLGAWIQFGADEFFSEDQIKQAILAWRDASPAIVEFWGGQKKKTPTGQWYPVRFGIEGAAIQAVEAPGVETSYRGITYIVRGDILFCRLLSGRYITYHRPRLTPSTRGYAPFPMWELTYETWNTNPKYGPPHSWVRLGTYGGRLTENIVQATARDILAHAIVNLEAAGYPVVLHVHDEIVAEVPEDFGSIEEFENIMMQLPAWATGWPIKAKGGWRGKRYRKD